MRSFFATTALVSSLIGASWTGVSAREFTDPGSTWLMGSFHYDYNTLVPDGTTQTFSTHVLQVEGRPAFFVAPQFFMGPSLRWQKGWAEDFGSSTLFAGAHAGMAVNALAAPVKPYIGVGFSLYRASSEYDDFDSEDSSTDGTQFQVFGGWLYQIDHLGIGFEIAYERTNLDGGHVSDIALRGTLSGLLF
jgi:hypothetical protein